MRRLVIAATLAVLAVAGVDAGAAQADPPYENRPDYEQEFLAKLNALRADQGLGAYVVHGELVAKARDWSLTMAEEGDIWHSNLPDGVTANWRRLGENVGKGGSVNAIHDALVASPSHYENLVDPGFRHVGIGVTVDSDGTVFVSEVFMELASQPAPAAPRPAAGTPPSSPEQPASGAGRGRQARPAVSPAPTASQPAPTAAAPERSAQLVSVLDRLRTLDGAG